MAKSLAPIYDDLVNALRDQKTVTELFKLASSEEFITASHKLDDGMLKELRKEYKSVQTALDGKVKLEEFDGQILNIIDIDYWFSEEWGNEGVTLKYRPERDPSKIFKSLTSSAVIVRFAKSFDTPPTEAKPCRVQVHLEPVKDTERARLGQRIWKVKRLADRIEQSGMPF